MPLAQSKPRPERQTQQARRAESDRRLITAGIRLIAAQGTAGASLARIGEAAGYSRGLAAERFGSKQHFLEAVVDHMQGWFERRLAERLGRHRGCGAIEARIAQHLDGAVEATEATRALYHLYTDALGVTPALLPRMVALSKAFLDGFSGAIAEARDLGEIDRPVDPERKALLIFAAVRGVALQYLLDGDERRLRASERDLVAEVRGMMRRNPK